MTRKPGDAHRRTMRALATIALIAVLLSAAACRDEPQTATFAGATMTYMAGGARPTVSASVVLEDGTEVRAVCSLEGIPRGSAVAVEQDTDGTWIVTGVAKNTIADEVNVAFAAKRGEGAKVAMERLRRVARSDPRYEITGEKESWDGGEWSMQLDFADGSSLVVHGLPESAAGDTRANPKLERAYVAR
jgi:hypothetical protein